MYPSVLRRGLWFLSFTMGISAVIACSDTTQLADSSVRDAKAGGDLPLVSPPDGGPADLIVRPLDGWQTTDAFKLGCAGDCHGSATSSAPPKALDGQTATTARGVGAHQIHLKVSSWHATVRCEDCHVVPQSWDSPGHIDDHLPAELTFSALAKSGGATPLWNGVTCSGTYCHGATLSGGSLTSPVWTKVDGTASKCGACHSLPPSQNHSTSTNCSSCHGGVVDASMKIIDAKLHIDGKINITGGHPAGYANPTKHGADFNQGPQACTPCHGADLKGGGSQKSCETCHPGWQTQCNFCHGTAADTSGVPPSTVDGQTSIAVAGVGRHGLHRRVGKSHAPYACERCHKMPTDALSPGHIDPRPAEVIFPSYMVGSTYDATTNTCKNIYCHGTGKVGSGLDLPWVANTTCMDCHGMSNVSACSTCHDDAGDGATMTLGGSHLKHIVDKKLGCADCHGCVVSSNKIVTDFQKHINGVADVCEPSWNATAKTCTPTCHVQKTW